MASTPRRRSSNIPAAVGIPEPGVELAKADLLAPSNRRLEHRRIISEAAAVLLKVTISEATRVEGLTLTPLSQPGQQSSRR